MILFFVKTLSVLAVVQAQAVRQVPDAPEGLETLCTDDGDLLACAEKCAPAACCGSDGEDSCIAENFQACFGYASCVILLTLIDSGDVPEAGPEVEEFCTQDLSVEANLLACQEACVPGACCFLEEVEVDNCIATNTVACGGYANCVNLVLGDIPTSSPIAGPEVDPFNVYDQVSSRLLSSVPAKYSCTFTNQWSGARHPILYPPSAHWSRPVLVSHNSGYQMWGRGLDATQGVEDVAEFGGTTQILLEIENETEFTRDVVRGLTTFNSQIQRQTFDSIILTDEFPLLSTITMIADSPDWFSGFYDFDARSGAISEAETWLRGFSIDSYPWDAGTEQGDEYRLANDPQVPQLPISQFTVDTVPSNGIFLSPDQTTVLPVATWTCLLENELEACTNRGDSCTSSIECCSKKCAFGRCQSVRAVTTKLDQKLAGGGGRGGAAGGGRRIRGV